MDLNEKVRQYILLKEKRLALDAEVKEAKEAENAAKQAAITAFIEAGVYRVDVAIGSQRKGVSIVQNTFVSIPPALREDALDVCMKLGLAEMVDPPKVNENRVQAFVRECLQDDVPVAKELQDIITIAKVANISVTTKR